MAAVEYRQNMRSLQIDYLGRQSRLTVVFAGLIAGLGFLAFVVMLFWQ